MWRGTSLFLLVLLFAGTVYAADAFAVTVIEPDTRYGLQQLSGENTSIVLTVSQNGQPAEDVTVFLLDNGTRLNTTTTRVGDAYRAYFTAPANLETVDVEIMGVNGQARRFDFLRLPTRPWPLYGVVFFLLGAAALGVGYRFRGRLIAALGTEQRKRKRLEALRQAREDVKQQYFNREISEDVFKEQVAEYDREINALEHELENGLD